MSLRVGLVGCGNISEIYLLNARQFTSFEIVACADLDESRSRAKAESHGVAQRSLPALLADPAIDIVLNLTPAQAHADVSLAALGSGKHVYSEKPLAANAAPAAAIVERARQAGRRVGCAPDTVLGANVQAAARLLDGGEIGDVVFATAGVLSHGMEHWHPDPRAFYQAGGGPVLDMGPYYVGALVTLLGPVVRVQSAGRIGIATRTVTTASSALRGQSFTPEVQTTVSSVLQFAGGAQATLVASWDAWAHAHPMLELHATGGSLRLADPNWFGGPLGVARGNAGWVETPTDAMIFGRPNRPAAGTQVANYRGLGLAEMAAAISAGRPHLASGEMALHVLQVLLAIGTSAGGAGAVDLPAARFERPRLSEAAARELWRDAP